VLRGYIFLREFIFNHGCFKSEINKKQGQLIIGGGEEAHIWGKW
jgi:hypothetical protein